MTLQHEYVQIWPNFHVSDTLWSIKWLRWTMIDETNGMDFGLWTQQRWSCGKIMKQRKHSWGGAQNYK